MELVGLSYSSWFVYRYLLFKARAPRKGPTANHARGLYLPAVPAQPARGGAHVHLVWWRTHTQWRCRRQQRVSAAGACFWHSRKAVRDLSFVAAP